MTDINEQLDELARGTEETLPQDSLRERLSKKDKLIVKAGFDPTAPDLHLGHTVVLRKLRQFQDFGHKAVLVIGGYTAMIGDPTGKTKTRPALDAAEIQRNAQTYLAQAGKVLDTSPDKLEIRNNADWLLPLTSVDVLIPVVA